MWVVSVAVVGATALAVTVPSAQAGSAVVGPWTILDPTVTTWNAYYVDSNDQRFRWITDPPHSSRVSTNWCSDYSWYVRVHIGAHDTTYHSTHGWSIGTCIALRAVSEYGSQTLYGSHLY